MQNGIIKISMMSLEQIKVIWKAGAMKEHRNILAALALSAVKEHTGFCSI